MSFKFSNLGKEIIKFEVGKKIGIKYTPGLIKRGDQALISILKKLDFPAL